MGFTTGFLGGATLTTALLYGTVLAHKRHRQTQALALRQSTQLLSETAEPSDRREAGGPAGLVRADRVGVVETAKDRWNDELARAVRWAQTTDWRRVREGVEEQLGAVAGRTRAAVADAGKDGSS